MKLDDIPQPSASNCESCGAPIGKDGQHIAGLGKVDAREAVNRLACIAIANPCDAVILLLRVAARMSHKSIAAHLSKVSGRKPATRQAITSRMNTLAAKYPALREEFASKGWMKSGS